MMTIPCPISGQTPVEEIWNTITHGLGVLLSLAGLAVLVVFAALYGDAWHVVSCSIYGSTLILLYGASSLYHASRSPKWKTIFLRCDYCAIYLMIAGSYTPFALVTLNGKWGWWIFGIQWGMALVGMIVKGVLGDRLRLVSTAAYLVMGWMVLVALVPLSQNLEPAGILLVVAGGLTYTFGVIFFLWDSLPLNHVIWHLFVLAGSAFHYFAILHFVVL